MLHSICQQIWNTQQWPQDWKRLVFIPIPKKYNAKECSNYHTIALISHAGKVILKILQVRLQQYMNHEHPDFKLDLEKAEEPQIKSPTSVGSSKKQESSRKTSISALLTMTKPWAVWITTNCGQLKRQEYQTTWSASWEISMQVRKQPLELDMEQQNWFQIGKGVHQGCILSPYLFNLYPGYIMWNASLDETQTGITIAGRNITNLKYADDTTLMAGSKEPESLLMKVRGEWKSCLKTQHSEN